jgi:hypothetical protein
LGVGKAWISSDSLVRIETYQGVTRKKARIIFLVALPPRETRRDGAYGRGHAERRIIHEASLTTLLIFCNELSSEPLPFGGLNPKSTR